MYVLQARVRSVCAARQPHILCGEETDAMDLRMGLTFFARWDLPGRETEAVTGYQRNEIVGLKGHCYCYCIRITYNPLGKFTAQLAVYRAYHMVGCGKDKLCTTSSNSWAILCIFALRIFLAINRLFTETILTSWSQQRISTFSTELNSEMQ